MWRLLAVPWPRHCAMGKCTGASEELSPARPSETAAESAGRRGSMCGRRTGRLDLKLAAGLPATVSPVDERKRKGQGAAQPFPHIVESKGSSGFTSTPPRRSLYNRRPGLRKEPTFCLHRKLVCPLTGQRVPAPTQHLIDFSPPPHSLCRPLGNCCGKRQQVGKAVALLSVLIHKTDWRHIFSQAAAAASPAGALFKEDKGSPSLHPSSQYNGTNSTPRSRVDELAAIDLKCKGPSSCPNRDIDGPKEPLTPQKRHRLPRPNIS